MLKKVRSVNRWIEDFNSRETGIQFDLGKYGVIGDPSKGDYVVHEYKEWKELNVERKLHLTDQVKNEIAYHLVNIFIKLS